jgi:phosphoglycolate phosphatase-like HAD superfamily hydrolase
MKKVIFDFDGTLLDSRLRHKKVLEEVVEVICNNKKIPFDDYLEYKANGFSTVQYLSEIKKIPTELSERIAKKWIALIEQPEFFEYDFLYPDVQKTLRNLSSNYDLYLLSARKSQEQLYEQVRKENIEMFFEKIICVSPFDAKKEKIMEISNIEGIVLSIGDTEVDKEAASYFEIPFYALNRGFRSEKFWEKQGVISYKDLENIHLFL